MPHPYDIVTGPIIGAAIEVHRQLGPGLLESAYQRCLALELTARGIPFQEQVPVPLRYRDIVTPDAYKLDFLIGGRVVIELKSVVRIEGIHLAQLLTYVRLANAESGLLLNFNEILLRDGIRRVFPTPGVAPSSAPL